MTVRLLIPYFPVGFIGYFALRPSSGPKSYIHHCFNYRVCFYSSISHKLQLTSSNSCPYQYPFIRLDSLYKIPTLNLHRSETPSSLDSLCKQLFREVTNCVNEPRINITDTYHIPLILDLSSFQPYGSPHYISPSFKLMNEYLSILHKWGIKVIGLTNVSRDINRTGRSIEFNQTILSSDTVFSRKKGGLLEEEVKKLGIPVLSSQNEKFLGLNSSVYPNIRNNSMNKTNILYMKDIFQYFSCIMSDTKSELYEDKFSVCEQKTSTKLSSELELHSSYNHSRENINLTREDLKDINISSDVRKRQNNSRTYCKPTGLLSNRQEDIRIVSGANNNKTTFETSIQQTSMLSKTSLSPCVTKIYTGTVRSGQKLKTDDPYQSLVVIGNVNSGGEVIAGGDIYIFGRLRGKAKAGSSYCSKYSNHSHCSISPSLSNSRKFCPNHIFASTFDPEFISVGDLYTTLTKIVLDNQQILNKSSSISLLRSTKSIKSCLVRIEQKTNELIFEDISL